MSANEKSVAAAAKYVPVLPEVKARALPVDPGKGYLVMEVKPGVFVITDGAYQSAFVTTGQGVILLDAPPTFAQHIQEAVADVKMCSRARNTPWTFTRRSSEFTTGLIK